MRFGWKVHRTRFHALLTSVTGVAQNHLKNLIALMDFFILVLFLSVLYL